MSQLCEIRPLPTDDRQTTDGRATAYSERERALKTRPHVQQVSKKTEITQTVIWQGLDWNHDTM